MIPRRLVPNNIHVQQGLKIAERNIARSGQEQTAKFGLLIRHHSDRRAAPWGSDSLNVAFCVNGFSVFIGRQIDA